MQLISHQLQEKQSLNKATFYEASNEQLEALQQELHELQSAPPKRRKATEGRQEQLSAEISCIRSRSIDVELPEAEAMVHALLHSPRVICCYAGCLRIRPLEEGQLLTSRVDAAWRCPGCYDDAQECERPNNGPLHSQVHPEPPISNQAATC